MTLKLFVEFSMNAILSYRACIRPEVSRTITIGRKGTSNGQYFDKHLKFIGLNKDPVDFSRKNLTYLIKVHYQNYHSDTASFYFLEYVAK